MQGEQLKAMRKAVGMTQQQLGEALGLSAGYIGELQRNEKTIDAKLELAIRAAVERHGVHPFALGRGFDSSDRKGVVVHMDRKAIVTDDGEVQGYVSRVWDHAFPDEKTARMFAVEHLGAQSDQIGNDVGEP